MATKLIKATEKLTAEQIKAKLIEAGFDKEQFNGRDVSYLPANGTFTDITVDEVEGGKKYVRLNWKNGKEEGNISLGRINAYGLPCEGVELTEEMTGLNKDGDSLYIKGRSINSNIPNDISLACAKLLGKDFKAEAIDTFALPFGFKSTDFDELKQAVTKRTVYKLSLV